MTRLRSIPPAQVYEAIAKSLRDFGYPDCTAAMIEEIYAAMKDGDSGASLPHGIIGMMAESQLTEAKEAD